MRECSKAIPRRLAQANFARRYFVGDGVDIGGAPDPLALYAGLFPLLRTVRTWDIEDGDAQYMAGVADGTYDFVHSSHCLEHLHDPAAALRHWLRILRPGGAMIVMVPDEDLYEQGQFPSTFNADHKWTFSVWKATSWSARSLNILDLLRDLGPEARPERVELLDATYRYDLPRLDQTRTPVGECGIEFIVRRAGVGEAETGQRSRDMVQPAPELRRHYHQYVADGQTLRTANGVSPPFAEDGPL